MTKHKGTAIVAAACLLLIFALSLRSVSLPRRDLDRFLVALEGVEVGKTTIAMWREQLQNTQVKNVTLDCKGETCSSSWRTDNRFLHRLRLAPLTAVEADVTFKDGVAAEIYMWVEVENRHGFSGGTPGSGATVHEGNDAQSCNREYSADVKDNRGYHWVRVTMDSCVSSLEKAKALAVNSSCLTKIGGCATGEAILPGVFDHL